MQHEAGGRQLGLSCPVKEAKAQERSLSAEVCAWLLVAPTSLLVLTLTQAGLLPTAAASGCYGSPTSAVKQGQRGMSLPSDQREPAGSRVGPDSPNVFHLDPSLCPSTVPTVPRRPHKVKTGRSQGG